MNSLQLISHKKNDTLLENIKYYKTATLSTVITKCNTVIIHNKHEINFKIDTSCQKWEQLGTIPLYKSLKLYCREDIICLFKLASYLTGIKT